MVRRWREWIPRLARAAAEVLGEGAQVYVFGSAAEGGLTAASDVDVLMVADAIPDDFSDLERLKERIEREAGLPRGHPFELHLVDREGARFYLEGLRVRAVRVA